MSSNHYLAIALFLSCQCLQRTSTLRSNALKYFFKHRELVNFSSNALNYVALSDPAWVEYSYYFKNKKEKEEIKINSKLKIGVYENSNLPFDCHGALNNPNGSSNFGGYSKVIFDLLQESLNVQPVFIKLKDSSEESIVTSLLLHETDLVLCHSDIDHGPEVEELHPTLISTYVLIYKPTGLHFTKDIFILTFVGSLWICFLVMLAVLTFCLRLSSCQYIRIGRDYGACSWVDITLWIIAAACQQGSNNTPRGFSSKFIYLLTYVMAYLLYTGFAAGITSLLLQQDVRYELKAKDLGTKFKIVLFPESNEFEYKNVVFANNIDHLIDYLGVDNTVGIVPKIHIEQIDSSLLSEYVVSGFGDKKYERGFLMLRTNRIKPKLNRLLLKLQQAGLINKALGDHTSFKEILDTETSYSNARLEHVGSAIILLGVGVLASIFFLLIELIVAFYRYYRSNVHNDKLQN